MEKLDGQSMDIIADNIDKMKQLFPDAFSEEKIDFDALKALLGDRIEDSDERYQFNWNGKNQARMIAQTPSMGTLRPSKEASVDWDNTHNLFIEGDNLEVLKLLQKSYHKKVKMIYIDPPYNTGKDFVYKDNFKDNIKNYKSLTGQVDGEGRNLSSNPETSGRYHTDWLNMMYPRLKLARNLLQDDGVIFISIDDNEVANLRKVCDEIFGEENLLFEITLLCNPKGRSQDKFVANCHEYLIGYSKSLLAKGTLSIPKDDVEIANNYKLTDARGSYREIELRNTHREFGKHNRKNLYYPFYISSSGELSLYEKNGYVATYPDWEDGFEGCWTWGLDKSKSQINELIAKKVKGRWKMYRKNYAVSDDGEAMKKVKSIWADKKFHTEKGQSGFNKLFDSKEKIFQSPKSINTIQQLAHMGGDNNALFLDFFAGSATTAHALMQLNAEDQGQRKFIMVQLPEATDEKSEAFKAGYHTIAEISKERIRRAAASIKTEQPDYKGDLGFKAFKLDSSNIQAWDVGSDISADDLLAQVEHIKAERSEADVLYEILLKYGHDLSVPIAEHSIAGQTVYVIGNGSLLVCLGDAISLEVVEAMVQIKDNLQPSHAQVVFKDTGFGNDRTQADVTKANAVQTLKQAGITDVRSL